MLGSRFTSYLCPSSMSDQEIRTQSLRCSVRIRVLQQNPWTKWSKDQLCGMPTLQYLPFFPISLSCKHTPGLPSCSKSYFWLKYPENDTFPQENQFGLISFCMLKIICQKIRDQLYTAFVRWFGGSTNRQILRSLDHSSTCSPLPAFHHFFSVGIIYCHTVAMLFQILLVKSHWLW